MEYTYEDWKDFKKAFSLKNKDIAAITGTSESNIKTQLSPSKKLPTWAKAMIWVNKQQPKRIEMHEIPVPGDKVFGIYKLREGADINNLKPEDCLPYPIEDTENDPDNVPIIKHDLGKKNFPCGCFINDSGLFMRRKACKINYRDHL